MVVMGMQVVVRSGALGGFCSAAGSRRLCHHGERELNSPVAARLSCCSQPTPWQVIAISCLPGQIQPQSQEQRAVMGCKQMRFLLLYPTTRQLFPYPPSTLSSPPPFLPAHMVLVFPQSNRSV